MHTYTISVMGHIKHRALPVLALAAVGMIALSSCGAGTRTDNENATTVSCDYTAPEGKTTVNVLAYNSSAIDPFRTVGTPLLIAAAKSRNPSTAPLRVCKVERCVIALSVRGDRASSDNPRSQIAVLGWFYFLTR